MVALEELSLTEKVEAENSSRLSLSTMVMVAGLTAPKAAPGDGLSTVSTTVLFALATKLSIRRMRTFVVAWPLAKVNVFVCPM